MSWIDNAAGLAALEKGFGRDPHVNDLWTLASSKSWVPQFEWVPSALNLADPISRGDLSVVQAGWRRLASDTHPFESLLANLHTGNMEEMIRTAQELRWDWRRRNVGAGRRRRVVQMHPAIVGPVGFG